MFGSQATEQDAREFWNQKEKEKGGTVGFYTFATFLGRSNDKTVSLGGLIYTIDDTVYFEDFEKDSWFAKFLTRKNTYEKTEFSFLVKNVAEVKVVSKNSAYSCVSGYLEDTNTKPFSKIMSILFQSAVQIRLKRGGSLFFDIMRSKDFINALKRT